MKQNQIYGAKMKILKRKVRMITNPNFKDKK